MPDRIGRYLNSVFLHTGVELSERVARMVEMRAHIETLAEEFRAAGACPSCAERDALEEFGAIRVLRRRFAREQWRRDFAVALRATARQAWIPLLAGLAASAPAWLLAGGRPSVALGTAGLESLLIAAALVFGVMVAARVSAARIQRPQPAAEFRVLTSLSRWATLIAGVFVAIATAAAVLASTTFATSGYAPAGLFLRQMPRVVQDQASQLGGISLAAVAAAAVGLMLYERRRAIAA